MGVKMFAWIGGLALFLGVAFFVKYSFDNNLIPPQLRVAIGFLTGLGLLVAFFVAGKGVSVTFSPSTPGPRLAGLGTVEEGKFVDGRWIAGRQLAGDETEQGDNLSFRDLGIQRVTLYRYD